MVFLQILTEVGMSKLGDELMEYFTDVVLETANRLQRWSEPGSLTTPSQKMEVLHDDPCNDFAEELLKCTRGLPIPTVSMTHFQVPLIFHTKLLPL